MPDRSVPQAIDVIRGGLLETAPDNHAETVADCPVARRAVRGVAGLATFYESLIDGDRKRVDIVAVGILALVISAIFFERSARDGSLNFRTAAASVGKEVAAALRLVFRLILHIEPGASRKREARRVSAECCGTLSSGHFRNFFGP